mmetsp:Transcript_44666/g.149067  ORF Transcript_44666/g.149067 Transcript_44666/m.149067 type:complete len:303 (-) Transcript_44666:2437-3345(-)
MEWVPLPRWHRNASAESRTRSGEASSSAWPPPPPPCPPPPPLPPAPPPLAKRPARRPPSTNARSTAQGRPLRECASRRRAKARHSSTRPGRSPPLPLLAQTRRKTASSEAHLGGETATRRLACPPLPPPAPPPRSKSKWRVGAAAALGQGVRGGAPTPLAYACRCHLARRFAAHARGRSGKRHGPRRLRDRPRALESRADGADCFSRAAVSRAPPLTPRRRQRPRAPAGGPTCTVGRPFAGQGLRAARPRQAPAPRPAESSERTHCALAGRPTRPRCGHATLSAACRRRPATSARRTRARAR